MNTLLRNAVSSLDYWMATHSPDQPEWQFRVAIRDLFAMTVSDPPPSTMAKFWDRINGLATEFLSMEWPDDGCHVTGEFWARPASAALPPSEHQPETNWMCYYAPSGPLQSVGR